MKTIAVIFGGRSAEHDISIVTALGRVIKPLQLTGKYKVEPVYIAKDGSWYWHESLSDITLFTNGKIEAFLEKSQPVQVLFNDGLTLVKPGSFKSGKSLKVDIVFPAMHGTYGEDGSLMGLLEMANVPYVGCGLDASVAAMDKVLAKQLAEARNIPVAKYVQVTKDEFETDQDSIAKNIEKSLNYPLFVKPAHLGSSIGINRVVSRDELINAIEVAVHYDNKVVVEQEIPNLVEVTLPIMGNSTLTPALLERPLTSAEDFFDFETKYMQGGKKGGKKGGVKGAQGYSELPAKLNKDLYKKAEDTALATYRALNCSGIARIDLLIDSKTDQVYFNEANPMPGDLYSHNWQASGISLVELVGKLVDLAIERHAERQKITTAFTTNYLQQF